MTTTQDAEAGAVTISSEAEAGMAGTDFVDQEPVNEAGSSGTGAVVAKAVEGRTTYNQTPLNKMWILHPFGAFHKYWDLLVVALCIFSVIEVPILLCFEMEVDLEHPTGVISLLVDILFLIDIVVIFRTAYFARFDTLNLVSSGTLISKRYLFGDMGIGWFLPDLLMSLPFEFILPGEAGIASEIFKMLRVIKLIRMFDILKSKSYNRHYLHFLRFVGVFGVMLCATHWAGCLWYFVGYNSITDDRDSWLVGWLGVSDKEEIEAEGLWTLYSYCWYWSVITLFTTGYGDITATEGNLWETWISTIVVLIGTCFVAYFIGTINSLILDGDRTQSVQLQKVEEAQAFCDQKRLSPDLSRAITTHIRYHCHYNFVFDEADLISSLPPNLQHEVERQLGETVLC